MKVHAISIVKDEADIISQTFGNAVTWCDQIYVFDNGSTDGTWEILQKLAKKFPNIVLFGHDNRDFSDTIRSEIFNAFKSRGEYGDWWCKLDADELYIDHPHRFLTRVPEPYDLVFGSSFQYYFTERDLQRFTKTRRYTVLMYRFKKN